MFYLFHDKVALEKETSEQIKKLQASIDSKHISKEDSKSTRKEMHKFKGLTMYLYDGETNVDREYLISNLENKSYIQTSSFIVRLYEPLSQQYDLKFYDGTYTLYVDSFQGVSFMIRYLLILSIGAVLLFISIIMIFVHRKMRYVLEIGEEMKLIEDVELTTFTHEDIIRIVSLFCEELKERHFRVYKTFDTQPFQIRADQKLLNRIYDNLLSNICKYAEKDMIVVSLTLHQGQVMIKVKNKKKSDATKEESTRIGIKSIRKNMKDMGGNVSVVEDMECFSIELIFPCREISTQDL